MSFYGWRPYVPVGMRKWKAQCEIERLKKKGRAVSPVVIEGRTIARTFWGKAWCANLEGYSDYANRLPRGRAYVRNGLVLDLQIAPGEVVAAVSGSAIYRVVVTVAPVQKATWKAIAKDCAGAIDSLVELLQGRFSKGVMERLCRQRTGLFPSPAEIELSCNCPDWASMCKHVAAVLYGIGARLDEQPELLFRLRRVDEKELIAGAGHGLPLAREVPASKRVLQADDLSELFGVDIIAAEGDRGEERTTSTTPLRRRGRQAVAEAATSKATPRAGAGTKPAVGSATKRLTGSTGDARGRSRKPTTTALKASKGAPRAAVHRRQPTGKTKPKAVRRSGRPRS